MKSLVILTSVLLVSLREYNVSAYSLPGPRVYVVTPSPRPLQIDEGRSVPFYYHNWMRRMDNDMSIQNSTSTTMKTLPKVRTPDLIFAEFESDSNDGMKKSLRKLLEKEKIVPQTTTTTTFRPIYVPDEENHKDTDVVNYGLPVNVNKEENVENTSSAPTDYYSMYKDWYKHMPPAAFSPSTTQLTTTKTTISTNSAPDIQKVENIWHIIDSEKNSQFSGNWEEVPIGSNKDTPSVEHKLPAINNKTIEQKDIESEIDENFALPGFGSNPGNGAENESRAIRYEPNIRFPYVNLKPFQFKPSKKLNSVMDNRNGNNLMTSLDNFHDLKNPVRGEAQDVVHSHNVIDRYNPAQPYLPPSDYGTKVSKQNSIPVPSKATANLVPPPPPPKQSNNDFPVLTNPYESFPPYPSPSLDSSASLPSRPSPPKPPVSLYSPPAVDTSDNSGTDLDSGSDDSPPTDIGPYKTPPVQQFIPTSPPVSKPFPGYTYDKPPMPAEMMPSMEDKPVFNGYHYSKPESTPPHDDHVPHFDHHNAPPPYGHDSDYPELIFQKHHGDMDDSKGGDDMNGMVPPPPMDMKPEDHGPPSDDHGFPSDFPGDFKYHHDFDDHDLYHHHHHHTTTTTTTEMPRVNRYSYYYLGKKLYYLPLYFSVYFIVYVGALIIKAVLRHKIVYPNSWRPNTTTATFFSKRSVDAYLSNDNLHEVTGRVTHAIATAAEKYFSDKNKKK